MINSVTELLRCFPESYMNNHGEVIIHEKANEYFNIATCEDDVEIKCKVLEWLSRGACKTEPYNQGKRNRDFHSFMLRGINNYLQTCFTDSDMRKIYQRLGNSVNRELTLIFIHGDYDMELLER